jgi:imidazoleglycerol-phosphate dehydratase
VVSRKTAETEIRLRINLDGEGKANIQSNLPFLNHMLILFCRHGFFDLEVELQGDLEVDAHHTLEDLGIGLGRAIKEALGEKAGIQRYGFYILPMDEALVRVALDLSGRGRLFFQVPAEKIGQIGNIEAEVWKEFFLALTSEGSFTLHIDLLKGENRHHIIEAIFKGLAKSLAQAISIERRLKGGIPSSKGTLT